VRSSARPCNRGKIGVTLAKKDADLSDGETRRVNQEMMRGIADLTAGRTSDLEQQFYDHHWGSTGGVHLTRERERVELTSSAVPSGSKRILDVGCGDGRLSHAICRKHECFLVGFDLSTVALRQLRVPTCCGSAAQLPFPDRSFDVIVSTEMMEHLPEQIYSNVLKEFSRVADRFILITVPNKENLSENMALCPSCGSHFHVWGHQRSYSIPTLENLFDQFYLDRAVAFGDEIESYSRTLLWVRQKLAGGFAWEERTRCYSCQSSRRPVPRLPFLERICDSLNSRLWAPFSKRPGWLLGLYARQDGENVT
jgi:SAM-dependent methyltransferase